MPTSGRHVGAPAPQGAFFSTSNIVDELGRLVQLGMLEMERPEDSRRVYYVRTNSPLWDIVTATLEAIDTDADW